MFSRLTLSLSLHVVIYNRHLTLVPGICTSCALPYIRLCKQDEIITDQLFKCFHLHLARGELSVEADRKMARGVQEVAGTDTHDEVAYWYIYVSRVSPEDFRTLL